MGHSTGKYVAISQRNAGIMDTNFFFPNVRNGAVLLCGEAMGLFTAGSEGPCSTVGCFQASVAGAELNVAVGLSRLGYEALYLTRLGNDILGERIAYFMNENNISTQNVHIDSQRHTSFMMKSKVTHGDPETFYFRKDSAASALSVNDLESVNSFDISLLHLTGILPPLSESTLELTQELLTFAHTHGITVSFDPNLRPTLWQSHEQMVQNTDQYRFAKRYCTAWN